MNNNKIIFDSDATNTYIYADTATPENIEIHADGKIELRADTEVEVYSALDMFNNKIVFDNDSTNTYIYANTSTPEDLEIHADQDILLMADNRVGVKTSTPAYDLDVNGTIGIAGPIYPSVGGISAARGTWLDATDSDWTSAANQSLAVKMIQLGSNSSITAGRVHYYTSSGGWAATNANAESTSAYLIGMGTRTQTANNVMLEGIITVLSTEFGGTYGDGKPLYLDAANNGQMTFTAPSGTGDIVRIVGHALDSFTSGRSTYYQIYFRPSNDWIEV